MTNPLIPVDPAAKQSARSSAFAAALPRRSALFFGAGLAGAAAAGLTGCSTTGNNSTSGAATNSGLAGWSAQMTELEKTSGLQLGICAIVEGTTRLEYRSAEAIPMCSTFKAIAAGALLDKHAQDEAFWSQLINIDAATLVNYSPVTSKYAGQQMTLSAICDAALRFSDNSAGNLLLAQLGGPQGVTDFAVAKGFRATRLDRTETELNNAVPGDPRDTSTPADLAGLYASLLVGDGLDTLGQTMLRGWMLRNTTSAQRMRTGLPAGAELADKTGAGDYGVVNGVGTVFQRGKTPITLAVMTRSDQAASTGKPELIGKITASVIAALA